MVKNMREQELIDVCSRNDTQAANVIIDCASTNFNFKGEYGQTALMCAVDLNNEEITKKLIINGANLNTRDNYGWSALIHASSEAGCENIIEYLLANGANIHSRNRVGQTALFLAFENDISDCTNKAINILIKYGADTYAIDNAGMTILMHSSSLGYSDNVREIIVINRLSHEYINKKDNLGLTALMHAVGGFGYNYSYEVLVILIANGLNINEKDNKGFTPLIHAINNRSEVRRKEAIDDLIMLNANIYIKDNSGKTPLMHAAEKGLVDIIERILNRQSSAKLKAYINHRDKKGFTALMYASNNIDCIKKLIENGADINIKDQQGRTANDLSIENNYVDSILFFDTNGINYQDINGDTPVIRSCMEKHESNVLSLYENGADMFIKNNKGKSAFSILKRKRRLTPGLQALKEKLVLDTSYVDHTEQSSGL